MKKTTVAFLALALFACQSAEEVSVEPRAQDEPWAMTRAIEGSLYLLQSRPLTTGIDTKLYAIESGNNTSNPIMVTGGEGGKLYASSPDGRQWTQIYEGGGDVHDIAAGIYKFQNYWMAAADGAIYYTIYDGLSWTRYYSAPEIDFYAVGVDHGRLNRDMEFYIGGWGSGSTRLFQYYLWDDGASTSWQTFEELDSPVFFPFTAITGMTRAVYGVTPMGEFATIVNMYVGGFHNIYLNVPLYAAQVRESNVTGSMPHNEVYVRGENGYMARVDDYYVATMEENLEVTVIETDIRDRIKAIAVNKLNDWNEAPEQLCILAGGANGALLISLDGEKFTSADIGFEGDIESITYHRYTDSFFVAGGTGEIHEVKLVSLD